MENVLQTALKGRGVGGDGKHSSPPPGGLLQELRALNQACLNRDLLEVEGRGKREIKEEEERKDRPTMTAGFTIDPPGGIGRLTGDEPDGMTINDGPYGAVTAPYPPFSPADNPRDDGGEDMGGFDGGYGQGGTLDSFSWGIMDLAYSGPTSSSQGGGQLKPAMTQEGEVDDVLHGLDAWELPPLAPPPSFD